MYALTTTKLIVDLCVLLLVDLCVSLLVDLCVVIS